MPAIDHEQANFQGDRGALEELIAALETGRPHRFKGADLRGVRLDRLDLRDWAFWQCRLDDASFWGSNLEDLRDRVDDEIIGAVAAREEGKDRRTALEEENRELKARIAELESAKRD